MARKTTQLEIVLVAVAGDLEPGFEHPVPMSEPMPIGRSSKGLTLHDPLVSIQHAKITFDLHRGYVIEDLGSATGTWVDEECIRRESRPIGLGTRLRFGDTVLEVSPPTRVPFWMKIVGGLALSMLGLALAVFVLMALFKGSGTVPDLALPEPVQAGKHQLTTLQVPIDFLRSRGLHIQDLRIREITDHDYDGFDEVWLTLGSDREAVISFAPGSTPEAPKWKVLGEFPSGCVAQSGTFGDQFPALECAGTLWLMDEGEYRLIRMDGVVVYYRACDSSEKEAEPEKPEAMKEDAPSDPGKQPALIELGGQEPAQGPKSSSPDLSVGRFVLKNENGMAAFLVDRGITGPIHYVICEDAFSGIAGQALGADGRIQRMSKGCIHELRLEGTACGDPVAFALTAPGHQALIDDVRTFYAGNPDGLFMPPERVPVVEPLDQRPGFKRGGVKLVGETRDLTGGGFNPVPDYHLTIDQKARVLLNLDPRIKAAPKALTVVIPAEGKHRIPTGLGCVELEIDAGDFYTHGWRRFVPRSFMHVDEVGCGNTRLLSPGYTAIGRGVYDAQFENVDVRAVVETRNWGRGTDVTRARLTWRETPSRGLD